MTEVDYEVVDRILASQNITYTGRNIRDELAAAGYVISHKPMADHFSWPVPLSRCVVRE
jgi:hypothetical protein